MSMRESLFGAAKSATAPFLNIGQSPYLIKSN